jgi:16S rRNA A1518/A1519 N6-dimethyltransferase RsmA/KsgA/DIM1 with predicted DNA glycosylase/AP lyase activity
MSTDLCSDFVYDFVCLAWLSMSWHVLLEYVVYVNTSNSNHFLSFHFLSSLSSTRLKLAHDAGGPLRVIANLPYYIVSQVLFSFADACHTPYTPNIHTKGTSSSTINNKTENIVTSRRIPAISKAVVTMQLEVANRIVAKPNTKQYGIPSVVFQLYSKPSINFHIPPKVFFPIPKVDSALVTFDFNSYHPQLHEIDISKLRIILLRSFQQRRKMLRVSLKTLLIEIHQQKKADAATATGVDVDVDVDDSYLSIMSAHWQTRRPESLKPHEFLQLTKELYGSKSKSKSKASCTISTAVFGVEDEIAIWRKDITRE